MGWVTPVGAGVEAAPQTLPRGEQRGGRGPARKGKEPTARPRPSRMSSRAVGRNRFRAGGEGGPRAPVPPQEDSAAARAPGTVTRKGRDRPDAQREGSPASVRKYGPLPAGREAPDPVAPQLKAGGHAGPAPVPTPPSTVCTPYAARHANGARDPALWHCRECGRSRAGRARVTSKPAPKSLRVYGRLASRRPGRGRAAVSPSPG